MRFYADENFPLDVTIRLRNLGHDVLTALEDGRANQKITDEEVIKRATELERTILTINRLDFKKLHTLNQDHSGIVICTFDADFSGQADRIDAACKNIPNIQKQLIRVYCSA